MMKATKIMETIKYIPSAPDSFQEVGCIKGMQVVHRVDGRNPAPVDRW